MAERSQQMTRPGEESQRTMEEDIRKRGMLYIQQQRFGKKWKKVWSIIYRESSHSVSRMEFFEYKDSAMLVNVEKPERTGRKQENKKVIKLRDCIRVSQTDSENCPKDCRPFLVETTEKLFLFAAEICELEGWTQALCETAFPKSWGEPGIKKRGSIMHSRGDGAEVEMEDNTLYSARDSVMKDFKVTIRKTEVSEKCRLRGTYTLRTDFDSLLLKDVKSGEVIFTWPYRFLRRFGRDKVTFSFEAGRRCDSGEGNFEFETKQGNTLFQAVDRAINLQKSNMAPQRQASGGVDVVLDNGTTYSTVNDIQPRECPPPSQGSRSRLELPADKMLTGVKSLNIDTRPPPQKNQVKSISSCPLLNSEDSTYSQISMPREQGERVERAQEMPSSKPVQDSEYSLPFDAIAKSLSTILVASQSFKMEDEGCREASVDGEEHSDPLYDSIDESAIRSAIRKKSAKKPTYTKAEHIYDEPEGCAAEVIAASDPLSFYDNPEEFKGHAWKYKGCADPSGHEYPYNPNIDDYAVPKPPRKALLVNEEEEDSPYDNVMVKIT
ncbi:docking protein 2 [Brienomyrus brachyistius]|uniref:docking protein 2 n=1 Tax=Brienomyrus brachyistius TaxID=42636 RepID=UPI0020B2B7B6|nr:docking protein 2 [Brienomyrus brachyistius]